MRVASLLLLVLLHHIPSFSQQGEKPDSVVENYSRYKRGFSWSGLLQTRYTYSCTKNVDVNGQHFNNDKPGVTNAFSLKRARIQAQAKVNDHFDAAILVNLADFSNSNLTGKVLENAFIRYSFSRYCRIIAGQYRPFFGIEEEIPVDLIKSLDYSNMYYAFGSNGWQSFQTGVCVYGDITGEGKMPVRYYAGIHNGNGRNQAADNDNTKHVYGRLEAAFTKEITLGVNAGRGSIRNQAGDAWGGDVKYVTTICPKWKLECTADYKEGTNFNAFSNYTADDLHQLKDFRMRGLYVFPNLRYEYNHPRLRTIELSARYEYLDLCTKVNSNPRQTIIPMLSTEFADDYFACLQVGLIIDLYRRNVPLTAEYTHNTAVAQLQIRF